MAASTIARIDSALASAVDLARAAAEEVGGSHVADHEGVRPDGDRLVTHFFGATLPGYRGWHWAVTLTRVPRAKKPTVDEVVLLPGDGALLAPEWVPWSERLAPGDLSAGDLLPAAADDIRLVPGYVGSGDDEVDAPVVAAVASELFLGRSRVLSPEGRDEAAERWVEGELGPQASMATQAPAHCGSCGFLLPIAGSLRSAFGVCANGYSPADGRVVALDFGCGGHSDVEAAEAELAVPTSDVVYDDDAVDIVASPAADDLTDDAAQSTPAEPAAQAAKESAQPEAASEDVSGAAETVTAESAEQAE